jgi:hypothetical protein
MWTDLRFILHSSPSKNKWPTTQKQTVERSMFAEAIFVVSVHRTRYVFQKLSCIFYPWTKEVLAVLPQTWFRTEYRHLTTGMSSQELLLSPTASYLDNSSVQNCDSPESVYHGSPSLRQVFRVQLDFQEEIFAQNAQNSRTRSLAV